MPDIYDFIVGCNILIPVMLFVVVFIYLIEIISALQCACMCGWQWPPNYTPFLRSKPHFVRSFVPYLGNSRQFRLPPFHPHLVNFWSISILATFWPVPPPPIPQFQRLNEQNTKAVWLLQILKLIGVHVLEHSSFWKVVWYGNK